MTSSFTDTFGGSAVNPSDVAYAAYSFGAATSLVWPSFSAGNTNVAARFMSITATVSNINISMPDATLNSVGYDAIIFNAGSDSFNVVDFNGGAIATITTGQTYYLMLTSNATQAGTWQTIQFGVGTGSANASALAGYGLLAVAGVLDVNFVVNPFTGNFNLPSTGRAQLYNNTGGSNTITLPAAATVGNGFFFMLANNGSGDVTVAPIGGSTIDLNSTSTFHPTQSGFIISDGSNWETVGKGIENTFAVTLINLNVAGGVDVTETSAQAQNLIQQYTGVLTGNINVIMPTTVQLYFCNNLTTGAHTLTVKTAAGTGILVPQTSSLILYCDGTNIVNGFTATITSNLSLLAGSATTPSLSFSASTSTGIFAPVTGDLSVACIGTEVIRFSAQAVAVNYFGAVASASAAALALGAVGTDTNISINIVPKGTGTVTCGYLDGTIIGSNTAAAGTFTTLASAAHTITSSSATAFTVGANGATNPVLAVNANTGTVKTGLSITGAATGGTTALAVTDSGSNANLTIDAKGSGTIGIGSVSTGEVTITPATILSSTLAVTGHTTFEGVTSTGATGTGKLVYDTSPTIAGYAQLAVAQSFTASQGATPVVLTSSSNSTAINFSLSNNFSATLSENTTFANPSNIVAGKVYNIAIVNGAGPYTVAYGSYFKFPGGTVPSVTATNGASDILVCYARTTTFLETVMIKGFA
jgi:hypothetical protein